MITKAIHETKTEEIPSLENMKAENYKLKNELKQKDKAIQQKDNLIQEKDKKIKELTEMISKLETIMTNNQKHH